MPRLAWKLAAIFGTVVLLCGLARARVVAESGYTKKQTYNAALRYLRVDLGYEVTEKDPKAAYLLFEYAPKANGGPTPGAIEIVESRKTVKVTVRLPKMPRYHEQVLSDGLMRKLQEDYGPPPPRPDPEPDPSPDGGTE